MEELEHNPGRFLEKYAQQQTDNAVKIDLNQPMKDILKIISKYPVKTRFSLTGSIIVGRDIAHAKIKERLDRGEPMPQYMKDHIVYYAGPAKTPKGMASGRRCGAGETQAPSAPPRQVAWTPTWTPSWRLAAA